jgi:hypothetical protein
MTNQIEFSSSTLLFTFVLPKQISDVVIAPNQYLPDRTLIRWRPVVGAERYFVSVFSESSAMLFTRPSLIPQLSFVLPEYASIVTIAAYNERVRLLLIIKHPWKLNKT